MNVSRTPLAKYSAGKFALKLGFVVGFCAFLWALLPGAGNYVGSRYSTEFGTALYVFSISVFTFYSISILGALVYSIGGRPPLFLKDGYVFFFKWYPRRVKCSEISDFRLGKPVSAIGRQIVIDLENKKNITFDTSVIKESAADVVKQARALLLFDD